jgi:hypothetical protein
MVERFALMLILLAAVLAGCSSQGAGADAGTVTAGCEELADELIVQLQVVVDELSDATFDDLMRDDILSATSQQELDELEGRAEDAGCEQDEIDGLLAERADRIQGDGVIAEGIREALSEGEELPF